MAVKAYHKVQCSNLKVQSNTVIKDYFKIEKNPKKGLLPLEWVMLGYMAITVITMLFTFTKVVNPESTSLATTCITAVPVNSSVLKLTDNSIRH